VKRNIVSFLFCICLFFVAGCATVIKYTDTQYPPTDARKIEVFSSAVPKREYIELGEIILSSGKNLEKMKAEAAKLGADAIILTGAASWCTRQTVSILLLKTDEFTEEIGIKCVAIKFK
jgi:hypothetical protein